MSYTLQMIKKCHKNYTVLKSLEYDDDNYK